MTMEERQSSAFSSAAPLLKDLPSAPLTQRATEILRLAKLIESREAEAEAQASQRAHSDGSRSSSIDGEAGQEYQPQWTHFARREIQRLAEGLVAEAVGPLDYTLGVAESFHESQSLHLVAKHGIPDILAEAEAEQQAGGVPPSRQGLTIPEIAQRAVVHIEHLSAAIRLVHHRGYFSTSALDSPNATSPSPSDEARVFRNNALSDVLRSDVPHSMRQAVCFVSTDAYRAASAFPEAAKHETSRALVVASGRSTRGPLSAFNINSSGATGADGDDREVEEKETLSLTDSRPTAFQLANGTNEGYFDWLCRPENAQNQLRMSDGVRQLYQLSSRGMMEDFPWASLMDEAGNDVEPIVDICGGIGSLEMSLLGRFPDLRFAIYDRPNVVGNAALLWRKNFPHLLDRISFIPGDDLRNFAGGNGTSKRVIPAGVDTHSGLPPGRAWYLLRHVLHDWTDDQCVRALSHIRDAMKSQSQLLICDLVLHQPASTCKTPSRGSTADHGPSTSPLRATTMANFPSTRFQFTTAVQVLALNGGRERTFAEYLTLARKAGLEVRKEYRLRATDCVLVCGRAGRTTSTSTSTRTSTRTSTSTQNSRSGGF